jgi:hypothetical protein
MKDRHREHHAVTVRTKPAVHVLIHSDVYVLKFSDREHADHRLALGRVGIEGQVGGVVAVGPGGPVLAGGDVPPGVRLGGVDGAPFTVQTGTPLEVSTSRTGVPVQISAGPRVAWARAWAPVRWWVGQARACSAIGSTSSRRRADVREDLLGSGKRERVARRLAGMNEAPRPGARGRDGRTCRPDWGRLPVAQALRGAWRGRGRRRAESAEQRAGVELFWIGEVAGPRWAGRRSAAGGSTANPAWFPGWSRSGRRRSRGKLGWDA